MMLNSEYKNQNYIINYMVIKGKILSEIKDSSRNLFKKYKKIIEYRENNLEKSIQIIRKSMKTRRDCYPYVNVSNVIKHKILLLKYMIK